MEIIGPYSPWEPPHKIHYGCQEWYKDDMLHRECGPAAIFENGHTEWYKNDKLHREDGPAIVYANGYTQWWYDNKHISNQLTKWTDQCHIDLDNMSNSEKLLLKIFLSSFEG